MKLRLIVSGLCLAASLNAAPPDKLELQPGEHVAIVGPDAPIVPEEKK